MPEGTAADAAPQWLPVCAGNALAERGRAVLWEVRLWGVAARAFALRIDGQVVAYINRCAHVPTEMDWQPGEFLDDERKLILCTVHGAAYDPANGQCLGGPCGRSRLLPVQVAEREGQVFWCPTREVQPPR